MLPLIHHLATHGLELLRTILGPFGWLVGASLLGLVVWNVIGATREGLEIAQEMHQIPCPSCAYFTDDHRLKCPVHPTKAASSQAIDCVDFHPMRSL